MSFIEWLKESYLHLPMQVKAAFWFTICNFLQRAVSMLTTPVFTRILSTDQYGRFSTYLSWENVLMIVVSLTLYASMMNLYAKQKDRDRVLSAVTGLELLLTGSWLMAAMVFRKPFALLTGLSPVLICCIFLYILFYAGIQCWSFHRRYIYGYKVLAAVTLLLTVGSSVTGAAAVYFLSATAETRAIAATAVTAGIGLVIYLSIYKKSRVFYDKKMWRFAFTFSLALLPHHLSAFILQSSDKIMINYMCGPGDVAMYSVAYSGGSGITMVSSAVNQSFVPYQFQKLEAGEYGKLKKRANQVLAFVGIMLCMVMLMSKEIVMIFGGAKYLDSAAIIIPICLGVYFNYMYQMFARAQQYFEKKSTIVMPSVLCAALNLLLNFIFIR